MLRSIRPKRATPDEFQQPALAAFITQEQAKELQRLLLEGDTALRLGGRALDILIALIERPGQVLGKDALISRVWPSTVVEEDALKVHISSLRRAIRDGSGGRRYIVTVTGRGYSVVAPVTVEPLDAA